MNQYTLKNPINTLKTKHPLFIKSLSSREKKFLSTF
jgi:hypothetical protein